MPTIKVKVREKIAENITPEIVMVCDNSDYLVEFDFDTEWTESRKTAIFVWNGGSEEVGFDGNVCPAPAIKNSTNCTVGVEMGEIRTTTPAYIVCKKSIRDIQQSEFRQSGGEAFLTDYQKKADNRLNTSDKTIVGAINEVNDKAGQGGGGCLTKDDLPILPFEWNALGEEDKMVYYKQGDTIVYGGALYIARKDTSNFHEPFADDTEYWQSTTVTVQDLESGRISTPYADLAGGAINDEFGDNISGKYATKEQIENGEVLPPWAQISSNQSGTPGIVSINTSKGIGRASLTPSLEIVPASESDIGKKTHSYLPITPINLDYAVKVGITTNTLTLTDTEKADACEWLGALVKWTPSQGGYTTVLAQNGNGEYSTLDLTYNPAAYKIPAYHSDGRLKTNDPTDDNDCTNKKYVDDMVNKPYELIEEFTLTEASNFVRTQEPDGTAYNFKEIAIDINYGEKVAATNRVVINRRNFEETVSNVVKYSVYRLWVKNGVFNLLTVNGAYRGLGTAVNSFSDITLVNEYITSINLSRENGYPVGTIFKIYGVRA